MIHGRHMATNGDASFASRMCVAFVDSVPGKQRKASTVFAHGSVSAAVVPQYWYQTAAPATSPVSLAAFRSAMMMMMIHCR